MHQLSLTSTLRLALAKAESENRQLKRQAELHAQLEQIWLERISKAIAQIKAINEEKAKAR